MVGNSKCSKVITLHSGKGTGDTIYETADGKLWEKIDPWEGDSTRSQPLAVLKNGFVCTPQFDSN